MRPSLPGWITGSKETERGQMNDTTRGQSAYKHAFPLKFL
jgi:hypothetical protein